MDILIKSWMLNRLRLKGIEKEVFALIYSKTIESQFCILSTTEIAEIIGASKRTIQSSLKALADKDLIEVIKKVNFAKRRANIEFLNDLEIEL